MSLPLRVESGFDERVVEVYNNYACTIEKDTGVVFSVTVFQGIWFKSAFSYNDMKELIEGAQ